LFNYASPRGQGAIKPVSVEAAPWTPSGLGNKTMGTNYLIWGTATRKEVR